MAELTAIAVTLSPLVSDLIASLLSARARISMAARFDARGDAGAWLGARAADLVVVGVAPAEAETVAAEFFTLAPGAAVLTLSDEGRMARICVAGAAPTVLDNASAERLAEAVLASLGQRTPQEGDDLDP